jgi:hypothetical protein
VSFKIGFKKELELKTDDLHGLGVTKLSKNGVLIIKGKPQYYQNFNLIK